MSETERRQLMARAFKAWLRAAYAHDASKAGKRRAAWMASHPLPRTVEAAREWLTA